MNERSVAVYRTQRIMENVLTGKKARNIRRSLGVSLREVARRMGVSAAYLSDLERGRRGWSEELCKRYQKGLWNE